jgi:peroxiredoxin
MPPFGPLPLLIATTLAQAGPAPDRPEPVAFRLQDHRGAWHSLDEAKGRKLAVIAFLGVDCPLSGAYAPRLAELARTFEGRGVAFFGVDANPQDGSTAIGRFAESHGLPFPVLKDLGNELADRLGAERTPEVFVLDESRAVRYRGRIDDQYALGVHRREPTRRDLADALQALLEGRAVDRPRADAAGCRIGRTRKPTGGGQFTYSRDIAPILNRRCVACHRPGDIGPFALTDYRQAAGWSAMIAEVVDDGRMPPWHASADHGRFANDARLGIEEKRAVAGWVADGAPEGDPRDLPPPVEFAQGWRIPRPDLVVEMPEAVEIPAEGTMPYRHFLVDPKLTQDVWVRASQVRPGNPAVVHHLVVYVLPPGAKRIDEAKGDFLAAYAPGMPPRVLPDGVAKRIPAGSRLLFQLHYTPRGTRQSDRSRIGLAFADPATVRKELMSAMAIDFRLKIPPGAADHASRAEHRFDQAALLYSIMPHMHLRGKSMRFEAEYPDGQREILLDVPRYEFDWQNLYVLAEPKLMPEGTVLRCEGHFDNSAQNPNNPDPGRTVTFGEQTQDEMMVGYLNFALVDQDLSLGAPPARSLGDGRFEVRFGYRPEGPAGSVAVVGTFNDWKKDAHPMQGPDAQGRYSAAIVLGPGTHEYKFLIDGTKYRHDPGNPAQAGYYHNSVIRLGPGD